MDQNSLYNIEPDNYGETLFADDSTPAIIKVIGVGGGGGNAVNYMFRQNIPYVNFVLCNTDMQALEQSPVPTKICLGSQITHGLGAGNKPEVGRECAEASEEEIRNLFTDKTEMVFITAGMGGGTGTGAAPIVARIAKDAGMLTIGIVTIPFFFEGEKKILKAVAGAEEMKKHVDALLMINNENLIELYQDLNLFNAFEKADDTLANAARSISEIISEKCYINVDFQDVKTTLKDAHTAIIATAYGEGQHRVADAIRAALRSPLLKSHDINSSRRLLLKLVCSRDGSPITMAEMSEIRQFTDTLPNSIDVKWGIGDDPTLGEKVKVTVLASGFDVTIRNEKESNKDRLVIESDKNRDNDNPERTDDKNKELIVGFYGKNKLIRQLRDAAKSKYIVLTPQELDDHDIIDLLERVPSLDRSQQFNDEFRTLRQLNSGSVINNPVSNESKRDSGGKSNEVITF